MLLVSIPLLRYGRQFKETIQKNDYLLVCVTIVEVVIVVIVIVVEVIAEAVVIVVAVVAVVGVIVATSIKTEAFHLNILYSEDKTRIIV